MTNGFALVAVALAMMLVACEGNTTQDTTTPAEQTTTTSTAPSPPGTERMCTAIGCDSLLIIELSDVDIQPEQIYEIQVCVDEGCRTETITIDGRHAGTGEIDRGDSAQGPGSVEGWLTVWAEGDYVDYYLPEGDYGKSAQVSFTLTDASGEVLAEGENPEVPLERSQPNGPDCLPSASRDAWSSEPFEADARRDHPDHIQSHPTRVPLFISRAPIGASLRR